MSQVSIIGLDIAKHVFQAHGVDASGHAVLRKKISRARLLPFFARSRPAGWCWRRAAEHTTGRASSSSWVTGSS